MIQSNFYDTAAKTFLAIHKTDSSNANINYKLGYCYLMLATEKLKTITYLENAAKHTAGDYREDDPSEKNAPEIAIYYLGQAYQYAYRFDEALKQFKNFRDILGRGNPNFVKEIDEMIERSKNAKELTASTVTTTVSTPTVTASTVTTTVSTPTVTASTQTTTTTSTTTTGSTTTTTGSTTTITISINNILFDYDKSVIKEELKSELDKAVDFLKNANKKAKIEVAGHSDSKGSDQYNLALSKRRAESVANYLTSKGISSNRIKTVGYGESKPIASNENPDGSDNADGRAKNRRTEIVVVQ